MKRFIFLLFFILLMGQEAFAQLMPLPVTSETIGLWNFDLDQNDTVVDQGSNPLNGTSFSTALLQVPDLDPSFALGRQFSVPSSFVDLGVVTGSKLDFTGASELSVEAVIHLTSPAPDTRIIFSTENVRLAIVNNQLAGIIRQPGGLYGVISERTLSQNSSYRVGLHWSNGQLILTLNGRIDSKIVLQDSIQAPEFSNSRAFIGGDIFGKYFPGYIDDVRVQNVVGIDITDPSVTLVEPSSFNVTTIRPAFNITLSDTESGIDASNVQIFLNGVQQTNLQITNTQISGTMNDDFQTGILNEVKILVSDFAGNSVVKTYFFTVFQTVQRGEYDTDGDTIALWHMNDFGPGYMEDSSGQGHHGNGNPSQLGVGDGIFSKAKFLNSTSSAINFDGVRFNQKFTFEGWFGPTANYSSDEVLFFNGQITVARVNGGYIRVVFHTTGSTLSYLSQTLLLPVGETHHLAVTWDGESKSDNLKFFVDGIFVYSLSAVSQCDFDPIPKVGILGQGYMGMIDEVRVSSTTRTAFSIPTLDNQIITFLTLKAGTSVNLDFPELQTQFNTSETVELDTVKVRLNGIIQPASDNLVITLSGVSGTFTDKVKEGLNIIEVEFKDSTGSLRKKSQHFFKISLKGAAQYSTDSKTAGLWHFENTGAPLNDDSGNGAHFTSGTHITVPGWVGDGQGGAVSLGSSLALNCRSYTLEGQFKINTTLTSETNLMSMNGGTISQTLYMNPSNGNLHFTGSNNAGSIDVVAPGAFPVDSAFHHVAIVYDGSRGFSQLMILVDGQVKLARDFKSSCNATDGISLSLGSSDYFHMDEARLSREAKYAFNLPVGSTDRPEITTLSNPEGSTVSGDILAFSFTADDMEGINTQLTTLTVNGIDQVLTTGQKKLGFSTTFTSNINLLPGANLFILSVLDLDGNETRRNFYIYRFDLGVSAPYETDSFTKFLYHFDEVSGDFVDSSASTGSLPSSGWTQNQVGAFGSAASVFYGTSIQQPDLNTLTSYTVEGWLKRSGLNAQHSIVYRGGDLFGVTSDNKIFFRSETTGAVYSVAIPQEMNDLNFHHYAVVVDADHSQKNLYLLIDGIVMASFKVDPEKLKFSTNSTTYIGYPLSNGLVDELRFSTTARYNLVSTKE